MGKVASKIFVLEGDFLRALALAWHAKRVRKVIGFLILIWIHAQYTHTYYTHNLLSCPGLRNIIHSLDSCHLLPKEEPFVKKRKVVQSMLTQNIAIVE